MTTASQAHAFERNNYFYGKLLTSRDFKDEQSYLNQKRHLLNRLIHGNGIVWGLKVKKIDDHVLEIGSGVALDRIGREIVVGKAFQTNVTGLSYIPPEAKDADTLYLVLEYEECPAEPVPAIANASSCKETCEPNRIAERYKPALTNIAPPEAITVGESWHETTTLLNKDQFKLDRVAPKWVEEGAAFEITLRLTVNQSIPAGDSLVVRVEEKLPENLKLLYQDSLVWSLANFAAGTVKDRTYVLRADDGLGIATISGKTVVTVGIGGVDEEQPSPTTDIAIAEEETIYEQIVVRHFAGQTEDGWMAPKRAFVYLAELKVSDANAIISVSDEGRSYVYNNPLLAELIGNGMMEANGKWLRHRLSHQANGVDEIDVSNLQGVLAQPQKVTVMDGQGASFDTRTFQFVGDGVAVVNNGQAAVVTIAGAGAGQDPRPPIVTGFVNFNALMPGEIRASAEIALPIKEPCAIQMAIEYASPTSQTLIGIIGRLAEVDAQLTAIYDMNRFSFQILLQDPRPKNQDFKRSYRVRYWIIPPTEINQEADKESDIWYQDYVLSRLSLFGGQTFEQLSVDPLLKDKVKAEHLRAVLEKLSNDDVVKREDGDRYVVV